MAAVGDDMVSFVDGSDNAMIFVEHYPDGDIAVQVEEKEQHGEDYIIAGRDHPIAEAGASPARLARRERQMRRAWA